MVFGKVLCFHHGKIVLAFLAKVCYDSQVFPGKLHIDYRENSEEYL
jgi:hypothetical protein